MTAKTKPQSIVARIAIAENPQQVAELVSHAIGFFKANDITLRRINRAAVKRNQELAKP